MDEKMKFTGERYIPEFFANSDDEIKDEHENRYSCIIKAVQNKTVLDVACGSGYGSFEISKYAKEVIGVDISHEAINHAKQTYKSNNLTYEIASVEKLPFANQSFDVIVSFETIEHITEKQQSLFLNEIKRVLNKNGLLIISTPDKLNYSDKRNYKNEFHIKEFYENEFREFLQSFFVNVHFYYQTQEVCHLIMSEDNKYSNFDVAQRLESGMYIVAVCSNAEIENDILLQKLSVKNGKMDFFIRRILDLQDDIDEKNNWASRLSKENSELKEQLAKIHNSLSYKIIKKVSDKLKTFKEALKRYFVRGGGGGVNAQTLSI